jgi:ubiquitin carboxyl-terminal hydrolase 7
MYGAWEQYLGLEHPDTAPRKAHTANQVRLLHCFAFLVVLLFVLCNTYYVFILQNRHSFERPVKIYN